MGLDFGRAIESAGAQVVKLIPYKTIYREFGRSYCLAEIRKVIKTAEIDALLWGLDYCFEFDLEFFCELRKSCVNLLYIGDDEHYFDRSSRYYAQAFDLVLVANYLSVYRFMMYGVEARFFPSSFPIAKSLPELIEPRPDVSFVGSLVGKIGRRGYIEFLRNNGIDVVQFGTGTPGGVVDRGHMNRVHRSSKISLNFTGLAVWSLLDYDLSINRRIKQIKGRCQEIALAGGFVLSEYAPGIEHLFEIGAEIDVFRTKAELLDKVNYYLLHDSEREAMSRRAHERAVRDYDEKAQWAKILGLVRKMIDAKPNIHQLPVYADPIFRKAHSAYHLSLAVEFLGRMKLRQAVEEMRLLARYPLVDLRLSYFFLRLILFSTLRRIHWLRTLVRWLRHRA